MITPVDRGDLPRRFQDGPNCSLPTQNESNVGPLGLRPLDFQDPDAAGGDVSPDTGSKAAQGSELLSAGSNAVSRPEVVSPSLVPGRSTRTSYGTGGQEGIARTVA